MACGVSRAWRGGRWAAVWPGAGLPVELHFLGVSGGGAAGHLLAQRGLLVGAAAPAAAAQHWSCCRGPCCPLGVLAFSVLLCEGAISDWSTVYLREAWAARPAWPPPGMWSSPC